MEEVYLQFGHFEQTQFDSDVGFFHGFPSQGLNTGITFAQTAFIVECIGITPLVSVGRADSSDIGKTFLRTVVVIKAVVPGQTVRRSQF